MVWFLVDDVLPFHERVLRAGNAAIGLWVRAGAWSSGQLTDGFIPGEVARTMGSAVEIRRLVDVGLWVPEADGYRFHAWAEDGTGTKRQPTKAEVEERRRLERERKARARAAKRTPDGTRSGVPQGVPVGQPADVRPESRRESALPSHTRPYQEELTTEIADAISTETAADASAPAASARRDLALIPQTDAPIRAGNYPPRFEDFWAAYPRHEGKRQAAAAWQRATRRASEQAILAGAIRYRDDPNRDDAYTAHATTWLNRDGWDDAPLPKRRPDTQYERLQANAEATHEALARMGIA